MQQISKGAPRSALAGALVVGLVACGGGSDSTQPLTFAKSAALIVGPAVVASPTNATDSIGGTFGNAAVVNGALYLADNNNNRVLGYTTIPNVSGALPDFVIGAPDFASNGTLANPSVVAYKGKLYVTEWLGNQVAVFDPVPTAATSAPGAASPQGVAFTVTATGTGIGGMLWPETAAVGGGRLVVADTGHHRVLLWDAVPTADTPPDRVLGQADFAGLSANRGGTAGADTLSKPSGVWTDGTRLVVNDTQNNRVLIWNHWPTKDGQAADLVLGQSDFTGSSPNRSPDPATTILAPTAETLFAPYDGVFASGGQLFVADGSNNRVLIWNTWPTRNGQPADAVLGQADFTTTSTTDMEGPNGIALEGTRLIVGMNRKADTEVLIFEGTR